MLTFDTPVTFEYTPLLIYTKHIPSVLGVNVTEYTVLLDELKLDKTPLKDVISFIVKFVVASDIVNVKSMDALLFVLLAVISVVVIVILGETILETSVYSIFNTVDVTTPFKSKLDESLN